MRTIHLAEGADLDGFRHAVRALVAEGVPPDEVAWSLASAAGLFAAVAPGLADGENPEPTSPAPLRLPRAVATLIESIVRHRDPERYALL